MESFSDLVRFIRAHREELTLSAYIESTPSDPADRRNWRVVLRQQLNQAREALGDASQAERDVFETCAENLMNILPSGDAMAGGLACFCAAGGDLLRLSLAQGNETSVTWQAGPRIVPVLRVADRERALVVQVDRESARIARLEHGELSEVERIESDLNIDVGPHMGDVPRHGFHGGTRGSTATDDIQRQRREATDRLYSALLKRLTTVAAGDIGIILGGAPETTARVLHEMPATLAARTIVASGLPMTASDAEARASIRAALGELTQRRQHERVLELREQAHAKGHAAVGYNQVSRAVELHAISELIFSDEAWRRRPAEVEQLVQRALCDGAEVAHTDEASLEPLNDSAGGIVAALRFPLAAAGAAPSA